MFINSNSSFDNTYVKFPDRFYERLNPTKVPNPSLIKLNIKLAKDLGLDPDFLSSQIGADIFSGNYIPIGAEPLAMAYAGQQFGGWVPQLGDGRAILLGEVIDQHGVRRDIQLKGSGPTTFSRSGDGRAWIGPVLREYIISEAMYALNIPTTRALAAVSTGELIFREQALPGAVITRVASSHIRIGTFQFFSSQNDKEALVMLADHVIDRHYPDIRELDNPYLGLLECVVSSQASLIAKWMGIGFIHGVMNTDNMLISGETIDYGPCAFMDFFNSEMVYSSIDRHGRYSYQNQPSIAQWNLSSFATTLLGLIDDNEDKSIKLATKIIEGFNNSYNESWLLIFRNKLGLKIERKEDPKLINEILQIMSDNRSDFTLVFRRLCDLDSELDSSVSQNDSSFTDLFEDKNLIKLWLEKWRQRLAFESLNNKSRKILMKSVNPAYIPRNHRVEQAISDALENDYSSFEKLVRILSLPFEDQSENENFQKPPMQEEIVRETFCGT